MRKFDLAKGIQIASGAVALYRTAKELRVQYEEHINYNISIPADSYVFPSFLEWLNERTDSHSAQFSFDGDSVNGSWRYDGDKRTKFQIGAHTYTVTSSTPPPTSMDSFTHSPMPVPKFTITCRSKQAMSTLGELLEELGRLRQVTARKALLFTTSTYGWTGVRLPKRPIESVILPRGHREDVIADFDNFMRSESHYINVGIPWHRGYLFYGAPGNGKTSIALAMANHYGMHLYSLSLSSVKDDAKLTELVNGIESNSLLLIEDVDVFSKSVSRNQSDSGPTLAGMLNALDGVGTPHGLITIMTTNHPESLDHALVRPGRMDFKMEFKAPDTYQVEQAFENAYGQPLGVEAREFGSMAELINVLKSNMADPESARVQIKSV
jgi:hypothetical protein